MDKIVDCQRVTAGPPRWLTSLAAPLQALRNRLTFDLVRIVVALLLLGAAAAKWHQFQTGLAQSWSLQVMTILFEVVLGFWFLWGGNPRLLRRTGIGAFSVFACISLAKGLAGFSSCGCFGEVAVSPWLIFLVDVGVVLALLVATPANSGDRALAVPRIQPTVWLCALYCLACFCSRQRPKPRSRSAPA